MIKPVSEAAADGVNVTPKPQEAPAARVAVQALLIPDVAPATAKSAPFAPPAVALVIVMFELVLLVIVNVCAVLAV